MELFVQSYASLSYYHLHVVTLEMHRKDRLVPLETWGPQASNVWQGQKPHGQHDPGLQGASDPTLHPCSIRVHKLPYSQGERPTICQLSQSQEHSHITTANCFTCHPKEQKTSP